MQELALEQMRHQMKRLHLSQIISGWAAEEYGSQGQSLRCNPLVLRAAGFGEVDAMCVAAASAAGASLAADDARMRVS